MGIFTPELLLTREKTPHSPVHLVVEISASKIHTIKEREKEGRREEGEKEGGRERETEEK